MLALARGLIIQPRLLMIDEMSQGLAPTIVMELFRILERFTERGVAVLLVEQFVGQALALASRAYVLEKGEVGYAGPAKKLAADEEFVKGSYLGEVQLEPIEPVAAGDGAAGTSRGRAVLAEHVTVALPPVLIRALQERAGREGRQLSELVQEAVEGVAHDGRGPSDRTPRTQETSRRTANKASTRRSGKGGGRGR
jgi:ABC-type multidrug transport system ATPase subunit